MYFPCFQNWYSQIGICKVFFSNIQNLLLRRNYRKLYTSSKHLFGNIIYIGSDHFRKLPDKTRWKTQYHIQKSFSSWKKGNINTIMFVHCSLKNIRLETESSDQSRSILEEFKRVQRDPPFNSPTRVEWETPKHDRVD